MLSRRLVANLVAFLVVTLALVAYGVVDLLGNPLEGPTPVSANFPDASGLFPNFSVELNGVDVGTVTGIHLDHTGATVDMAINHGARVPGDVVASIDIANDLGEQVVELTPTHGGTAPPLQAGAVIPVQSNGIPANVGQVVATATRLLEAIPPGDLNRLLGELATALQNRAGDLRTIISAGTTFSREFLRYQRQFTALLANAPPVLDTVSAVGPQLRQALVNTESLVQVLASHRQDLSGLLDNGSQAVDQLDQLVTTQAPNLGCLTHDFADLASNLDQPANLANLSATLSENQLFFGAVEHVAVRGTAQPLVAGQAPNPNQYFLRTRLLLPPASPPADAYVTQAAVPAVRPGAACNTEFGPGAPAATQPGFQPADGGVLVPPSAADAQVHGGGDPATAQTTAADLGRPTADTRPVGGLDLVALVLAGALVLPGLLLAWAARPSRARLRRRG
ncbi:MAG: MCE family protein [Acidimicrobiales bacterium]